MLALTIARLTVLELLRRRLFLVLIGLTLLVVALTTWGIGQVTTSGGRPMSREQQILIVSQLLILVGFMFSFTLSFSAVFAGAPSLSGDVESGTALSILARPISRAEFVIGKCVGGVGLVLNNATATHIGTATRLILPPDGMWRGAICAFEPATIIAATRAS